MILTLQYNNKSNIPYKYMVVERSHSHKKVSHHTQTYILNKIVILTVSNEDLYRRMMIQSTK